MHPDDPVIIHGPPIRPTVEGGDARAVGSAASYPLGWYADPLGRFDRRYFNGFDWTEHVTRGAQHSTDLLR